jgi:Mn2+/Fe2+ NRAMP family transporter
MNQKPKNRTQRVLFFLASISPGIFLIGYNIGTGSVTTMATAGASYGMTLVWPLLLSCVFTYIMVVAFGRFTAITGSTALSGFHKHFGKGWALFVLASLLFSEWVSSMGVMGVVTQAIQEWSRPLTPGGNGIHPVVSALVFGGLLYSLFLSGSHRFFEKILALFVAIMGVSFVLTMFMVIPEPGEVLKGLVPRIPHESNAALLIAGMVGTTMGGVLYVVRSILVQEKGWGVADLKLEKRDALISVSLMFVLSAAIMACAAGTLYLQGLKIDNVIDMVKLLEPLAGRFAISIFVAGIVSAGLSSFFPIIILGPWLIADYRSQPRNMKSTSSRLLVLWGVLLGFVVPIFGGRPVFVMITSQALCAIATPVIVWLMYLLQNRKSVVGDHLPTRGFNIWVLLIFIFSVIIAIAGIIGLVGLL